MMYGRDVPKEPYSFSSDEDIGYSHSDKKHKRNSSIKKSPGRRMNNSNSTVSLLDFDRDYLSRERSLEPRVKVHQSGFASFASLFRRCSRWIGKAGVIRVGILGLTLGLLCAVVFQGLVQLGRMDRRRDNLLHCPSDELCIESSQLSSALALAIKMKESLRTRAGRYDCGVKVVTSRNTTLGVLSQQLLMEEEEIISTVLKNTMYLTLYNPHWGIRWLDREGNNKTRWNFPDRSDILESTLPHMTWWCRLSLVLSSLWSGLRLLVLIGMSGAFLVGVAGWYMVAREQERKHVYLMVDRVLDLLRRHYNTSCREKDLLPYLAIIHVRDTLTPPSERKQKEGIWKKTCEWISKNESRVRVENRRILGEDFLVWRWIQEDPPKTEEPSSVPVEAAAVSKTPDNGPGKEWSRWTAIDHYGPQHGDKVAPPIGTPSPYIRLKNMFDTVRMDDEQAKRIENSVLKRCSPQGSVMHIYVDKKSTFGCVYLKMESIESANKAYRTVHGGWYNGRLVTAKYIEETRYLKWFPNSATSKQPLVPS